jgi:CheY-like chemotaxis protein
MSKKVILFVDDEPIQTQALRFSLEEMGYSCVSLTDMTVAWNYLNKNEVEVVVSDIMMSGGEKFSNIDSSETGIHFVNLLRNEKPKISVICLSIIGDQQKIKMLKDKGVLYLRKGETPLTKAIKIIESKITRVMIF